MKLFVTAFHEETQSVLKYFVDSQREDKRFHTCKINNEKLSCLEVGIGLQNAKFSLEKFFSKYNKDCKEIFVVGFCGGLDPTLEVGQIVMPQQILDEKNNRYVANTEHLKEKIIVVDTLLSAEKVVRTSQQKKDLFREKKCQIVDMESAAIAEVALKHGVKVSVIKSILDSNEQEITQKNILNELKNNLKIAKERLEKDFLEKFICPF